MNIFVQNLYKTENLHKIASLKPHQLDQIVSPSRQAYAKGMLMLQSDLWYKSRLPAKSIK